MGAPLSRRDFLRGRSPAEGKIVLPGFLGGRPEVCSACSLCLERCPTEIIVMDDGVPHLDFSRGECSFCGECRTHCPHAADFFAGPVSLPHVVEIGGGCLARHGIDCQACRDHCPTTAIRFRPRLGGPFLPEIQEDACSGCGACISVCPVGAVSVKAAKELSDA
ncbi:nitrate reductase [Pseudorhizobium endolithicum]|uniref:Nitrate reductase n=1 Tax=Pseudorhizobium endolithicum TaxID=1191678 RepID=A0ABM8PTV2_9HYPH|nr:ferredoxin-type protein NapF [Pseudorhizobium endolithicum]CAD7048210.1 nitrate reductase [Pseudorhizobium endolithicum]